MTDFPVAEFTFQGAVKVTDIINGYRVSRRYFGYSTEEAVELFKQENS